MQAWHLPRDQIVIVTMGPLMLKSIYYSETRQAGQLSTQSDAQCKHMAARVTRLCLAGTAAFGRWQSLVSMGDLAKLALGRRAGPTPTMLLP
jgi:hypothetical protein